MKATKHPNNIIGLLEEIRAIAQIGLHYAKDPHDLERYERWFDLSVAEYSKMGGFSEEEVKERLRKDLGQITPKVTACSGIFNDHGDMLLIKRSDDGKWSIPGGYSEVYETSAETAVRETREETGLEVKAESLIDVFHRFAGAYGNVHTIYTLMYYCTVQGGQPSPTAEAVEVGYWDHRKIPREEWHRDIEKRVQRAYHFWLMNVKKKGQATEQPEKL